MDNLRIIVVLLPPTLFIDKYSAFLNIYVSCCQPSPVVEYSHSVWFLFCCPLPQ